MSKKYFVICVICMLGSGALAEVTVTNVVVAQRPGTKVVDITYDAYTTVPNSLRVLVLIKSKGKIVNASRFSGDVGTNVSAGENRAIVWDAGRDWNGKFEEDLSLTLEVLDGTETWEELGGDPMASSWVLVNVRWIKNIYSNGDITMTDRVSKLMWFYQPDLCGRSSWNGATGYCENLLYARHADWRLPNIDSLVGQYTQISYFKGIINGGANSYLFWSSSTYESNTARAWCINRNGLTSCLKGISGVDFWPVRSLAQD